MKQEPLKPTLIRKFLEILSYLKTFRIVRRSILILIDSYILIFSWWLCKGAVLFQELYYEQINQYSWLTTCSILIGIPIYAISGQYRSLTKYVRSKALYSIAIRNLFLTLILISIGLSFDLSLPPINSWLIFLIVSIGFTGIYRILGRDFLLNLNRKKNKSLPYVAIYGAGSFGAELASSLMSANSHKVKAFFDDDPDLWSRTINGIPIYPPQKVKELKSNIDKVFIAITSLSRNRLRLIVEELQELEIEFMQIPSAEELASGKKSINSLRAISIDDLLGRDRVPPDISLLEKAIKSNVICITGAGGSIGSELCRQISNLNPRRIILLESSEHNLYLIEQELKNLSIPQLTILPILGNTQDKKLVNEIFEKYTVQVVFHAAAYKHVPLVEANPIEGIKNNVLGTKVICEVSLKSKYVRQVILISTDKAVRPTNVMGASKRLAEIIIQAYSAESKNHIGQGKENYTYFSMVRFGNVLGSSGSVVPLFRNQIYAGGPITLTHPDMIRYFMTISEAAQLVIQASALDNGGEVFLLDMGEPVKIKHLAEQMVQLSGLKVKDSQNPDGDIEIIHTGLRPGEKLFEELLIDGGSKQTSHPLIYKAKETAIGIDSLWSKIDELKYFLDNHDRLSSLKLLAELIPDWENKQNAD